MAVWPTNTSSPGEPPKSTAKNQFQSAAERYLDPNTPPEERGQLRMKLAPYIRVVDGQEVVEVPK
jgi:hypothetical protein